MYDYVTTISCRVCQVFSVCWKCYLKNVFVGYWYKVFLLIILLIINADYFVSFIIESECLNKNKDIGFSLRDKKLATVTIGSSGFSDLVNSIRILIISAKGFNIPEPIIVLTIDVLIKIILLVLVLVII